LKLIDSIRKIVLIKKWIRNSIKN